MNPLKRIPLHVGDWIALVGALLVLAFGFGWSAAFAYYWSHGCFIAV